MMSNLYWSVYKNLERELIKLSDMVYFCDKQNGVYSLHIADLLVRTAIEIEAISKKIYQELGGNMQPIDAQGDPRSLYFDSDCIQLMDIKWKITKKIVNIAAANFILKSTLMSLFWKCIRIIWRIRKSFIIELLKMGN